ncbi:sulfatase family protein [Agaribacter flavus]|uniref:Arylsulfatase n=1 Tax=Agaribacter flavus TaxID=1902781 RepID=A0ABV7FQN4_9ALTE
MPIKMKLSLFFVLCSLSLLMLGACHVKTPHESVLANKFTKPNIVIFYVDDLGFGDLSAYGATAVSTPNIDNLAKNGLRFTDAHSTAATCTPSRYSLLTGEYAFRKGIRILRGDAAMAIDPTQATLPKLLQKNGYQTAVVGKWHLGLGDGKGQIDWNKAITPGPLEIGFDYSFLIPSTGDRVPSVYLENRHVVNLDPSDPLYVNYTKKIGSRPTGYENPELLRQGADMQHDKTIINGISRIGWMQGGKSAEWVDEDFHTIKTDKAKTFISDNADNPFFLYFSFHDIHVPRLPNKMFQGATDMGMRGDAIVQVDWMTGQIVDHLKALGLLENTLIIFSSDNGAVLTDGYDDDALELVGSHKPNGPFRGGKYSAFEAGTRVPFIVHYPKKVKPGVSDALFGQIDLYASIATLLTSELASTEAIDSENHLATLFSANSEGRQTLIEETPFNLSLRDRHWKYIQATNNRASFVKENKNIEAGVAVFPQLYDLNSDIGELNNLAPMMPARIAEMESKLLAIKSKTSR